MNPERSVSEGAFAGVPRLRHVSVEPGIRFIKAGAWQNCRQLRIVALPATVVGISDDVFRDCKLLNSVAAPGCLDFGFEVFAECCSLQWVYASEGIANVFIFKLYILMVDEVCLHCIYRGKRAGKPVTGMGDELTDLRFAF